MASVEYMEEALRLARKKLPGWAWAVIHRQALPRAGGRASNRPFSVDSLRKIAMSGLRSGLLRGLDDGDLQGVWEGLGEIYQNIRRLRKTPDDIMPACMAVLDELDRREVAAEDGPYLAAVSAARELRNDSGLDVRFKELPQDLVVVQDFVSVVGSTVRGNDAPRDLDVVVRSQWDAGDISIKAQNVWVPIRNILDPDKEGRLNWIGNAQGPHGDFMPLYDLVLRRRAEPQVKVVKEDSGPISERGLTIDETFEAVRSNEAKFTQEGVGYIEDTPDPGLACGSCRFFLRDPAGSARGQCMVVDGDVAWHGHSDLYISADDEVRYALSGNKSDDDTQDAAQIAQDLPDLLRKADTFPAVANGIQVETRRELLHQIGRFVRDGKPVKLGKSLLLPDSVSHTDLPIDTDVVQPRIAFVAFSPTSIERARGQALVGDAGVVWKQKYLAPLGLTREDAAVLFVHPDGDVAGDTAWVTKRLAEIEAPYVVALGKAARKALGKHADIGLPHPGAIHKFHDGGELTRKLKRIGQAICKQPQDEGGENRTEAAEREWAEQWHRYLPLNEGTGRFIYQRHWRGLTDDEANLDEPALFKTRHSLHGDLRLEGDTGSWGWTVITGPGEEAAKQPFVSLAPGDKALRAMPKRQHSKRWLDIGKRTPFVTAPGTPGATSQTNAKFFGIDYGTYRLGVVREKSVEIFLDGDRLKGRYIITNAPVDDGRQVWLIQKPEDQTPIVERDSLEDSLADAKRSREEILVWSGPGVKPQKLSARTGKVTKAVQVPIIKSDDEKQIVYGVVLDPYQVDAHDDWIPPGAIEDTAHKYMAKSRTIGIEHSGKATAIPVESWIEAYPSAEDYRKARRGEAHRAFRREYGADVIHSGAWMLGTKLSDELWDAFKKGEINAYSIGGFGYRTPISRSTMPPVTFVDLVFADEQSPRRTA